VPAVPSEPPMLALKVHRDWLPEPV